MAPCLWLEYQYFTWHINLKDKNDRIRFPSNSVSSLKLIATDDKVLRELCRNARLDGAQSMARMLNGQEGLI